MKRVDGLFNTILEFIIRIRRHDVGCLRVKDGWVDGEKNDIEPNASLCAYRPFGMAGQNQLS